MIMTNATDSHLVRDGEMPADRGLLGKELGPVGPPRLCCQPRPPTPVDRAGLGWRVVCSTTPARNIRYRPTPLRCPITGPLPQVRSRQVSIWALEKARFGKVGSTAVPGRARDLSTVVFECGKQLCLQPHVGLDSLRLTKRHIRSDHFYATNQLCSNHLESQTMAVI